MRYTRARGVPEAPAYHQTIKNVHTYVYVVAQIKLFSPVWVMEMMISKVLMDE